jgi:hypothetical protein
MRFIQTIRNFGVLLVGFLLLLVVGSFSGCVPVHHTSLMLDYRYPARPYPNYYYDHYYGPFYYYPDYYYGYYGPYYSPGYRSYPYAVPAPPSSGGGGRMIR